MKAKFISDSRRAFFKINFFTVCLLVTFRQKYPNAVTYSIYKYSATDAGVTEYYLWLSDSKVFIITPCFSSLIACDVLRRRRWPNACEKYIKIWFYTATRYSSDKQI